MKKYIFMAVAGMLALSSCSSDDNEQTPQNAPRQMTFTAGFGDGAQTRATLQADKSVTFDANDKISIFSANNNNVQFTTSAGGATATFDGVATAGDPTYYALYPYDLSLELDGDVIKNVMIWPGQFMDEGSWAMQHPPVAYATTTNSSLTFHNACALLKVTNDTGGDNATISISVTYGEALTGKFDLNTSTGTLTPQSGECYNIANAMQVPANATRYIAVAPGTFTGFTAECGSNSKTKTGSVTFAAGKIYDLGNVSSWAAPAAKAAAEATAEDKGKLIGTDGNIYADVAAATAAGTTAVAKIIYLGTTGHATYTHGLALALTDEGQMAWEAAKTTCNTTKNTSTPVTDATWLLASKAQWEYMMGTNGAGSYTALRDGFGDITGASNLQSGLYWSSTENDSDNAWNYDFEDGFWIYSSKGGGYIRVRACLAF